ncbi:MAG: ATP-binding cassette domain-containing protein [Acidimicrobiia bacterium]|nr:ATP-binding cassette domain-containing protein [Acidimicrobiia bacterium]MDH5236454.1 ATP-binding cassette domain-containing protein [Acidimicrobiia bacterium]
MTIIVEDVIVDHRTENGIVRALECETLRVSSATSLAIMGPSGCGKSTLLGLLAGLALPTRGRVTIDDVVVSERSERDRVRFRRQALGMVYQADNLLPHLTVEENVGLQLAICDLSPIDNPVLDPAVVLRRLGLEHLARRFPDQLSGGQRQRVAVARAIVHRPTVILADEPTGALDADTAAVVIELLVEVQREIGATLVVVTHDPDIAGRVDETMQLARPTITAALSHAH